MEENKKNNFFAEKVISAKTLWYNPSVLEKTTSSDIEIGAETDIYKNYKVIKNSQSVNIDGKNYQVTTDEVNIRTTNYDRIDQEISNAKAELKQKYDSFFQDYWNNKNTKYPIEAIDSFNINSSNQLNYNITKYSRKDSPNSKYQKYESSPISSTNKYLTNNEVGGAAWQGDTAGEYLSEMRSADREAFIMSSQNNLYLNYGQAYKGTMSSGITGAIISTVISTIKSLIVSGRADDYFSKLGMKISQGTAGMFSVGQKDNPITGEVKGETHYSQRLLYAAAGSKSFMNSIISLINGDTAAAGVAAIGAALSLTGYNLGITSFFGMYQSNAEAWKRTIRLMMFVDSPIFGTRIDNTRTHWDNNWVYKIAAGNMSLPELMGEVALKSQGFISNEYSAEHNQNRENKDINDWQAEAITSFYDPEDVEDLGELNPGPYKIYGRRLAQNLVSTLIPKKLDRDWLTKKTAAGSFGPKYDGQKIPIDKLGKRPKDNDFKIYFDLIELDSSKDNSAQNIIIKNRIYLPPTIMDFSDNLAPTWNELEYVGRPNTSHVYTGFKKTISFSFYLNGDSPKNHKKVFETLSFFENAMRPSGFSYLQGMSGNILLFNMSNLITNNIVIIDSFEKTMEGPWHLTTGMPMIYKCSISLKVLYDGAIESGFVENRDYGHDRYPNFLQNPLENRYVGGNVKKIEESSTSTTAENGSSTNDQSDSYTSESEIRYSNNRSYMI